MNKEPKKIILVIGSSMTMPRLEVGFKQTWLYNLIVNYPNFYTIDKSKRASTSNRLVNEGAGFKDKRRGADLLEYYQPNIIITQIGITDCAPRLLKNNSLFTKILNLSPNLIKSLIYKIIKKLKKRSIKNADVGLIKFESNWVNYIQRAAELNANIICILISRPTTLVQTKSPEISDAIQLYNSKLISFNSKYKNFYIIEPFTQEEINEYAIDEFHVSEDGHAVLFEKIKFKIDQIILNE